MMISFDMETQRLRIRGLQLGDERFTFPEITDELTRHWIGWEPPHTLSEERNRISSSVEKSREPPNVFCIALLKSGEFIGCCSIDATKEGDFEINLWVKKSAQKRGYAKEMLAAMIEWAKKNTSMAYLVYSVTDGNEASQKLIGKYDVPLIRTWHAEKHGESRLVRDYRIDLRSCGIPVGLRSTFEKISS